MLAERLRARMHEDDTLGCPSLHGAPPSTRLTPSSPTDLSCDVLRCVPRRLSERPPTVCRIVTSQRQPELVRMRHLGPEWSSVAIIFAAQGRPWRDTWTISAETVQLSQGRTATPGGVESNASVPPWGGRS